MRYFVKIAEVGSLSGAARQLHVAQPALSRHMRNLERELGAVLFQRTARGLLVTSAAAQLLIDGREILNAVDEAEARVRRAATVIEGQVTVGITPSVSMVLTNPLLRNMQQRAPSVSLNIVDSMVGNGREWLDWLRDEQLDFAIMYGVENSIGLTCQPLALEHLHLVGKSDGIVKDSEISFTSVFKYPLVLPSAVHPLRQLVDQAALQTGVDLRPVRESNSVLEVKAMVRWEGLCSILAPSAVWEERQHGELFAFRIVNPSLPRQVNLITPAKGRPGAAVRLTELLIRSTAHDLVEMRHWDAILASSSDTASVDLVSKETSG